MNFNQEYMKDLESDLLASLKCSFDQLLKYFLYRVLKDDCVEKIEIDNLQAKVESLQSARYYPKTSEARDDRTPNNGSGNLTTSAKARPEEVVDDHKNGTLTEQQRVEKREVMMDGLLKDALKEVLTVANNEKIKQLLHNFAAGYDGQESKRYGLFVELCNGILDLLKTAALRLPMRSLNHESINIRFQVNHPAPTFSHFQGYKTPLSRSPDFFISSEAALFHHSRQANVDYTNSFSKSLTWPIVLSAGSFEVLNVEQPEGVWRVEKPDFYAYEFVDEPIVQTGPTMLHEFDTNLEEGANIAHVQTHPGSKRSHDVALGNGRGLPSAKKFRMPTTTPLGTAISTNAKSATSGPVHEALEDYQDQKAINGRGRCASYAMEMLSYNAGVHHAITLLLIDGILWLCYHDRQGIIQSTGISVFHDFPRFIALLLAFQRFSLQDWGIIPALNSEAKREHTRHLPTQNVGHTGGMSESNGMQEATCKDQKDTPENDPVPPVRINLKGDLEDSKDFSLFWRGGSKSNDAKLSHVELNMKEYLSDRPHCLTGRATAVVLASGQCDEDKIDMACKIYHPEVQHRHEGLVMEVIYEIAVKEENQVQYKSEGANVARMNVLDHLPRFYFYGDIKDTTTHRIRSMVNRKWKGHRTMRVIGMKKLEKVTTLSGWDFVKAWLEGVICHAFLWKNYVEHGDPSISNLLYDPEGKYGVLTDFDLSLLQWEPRVFGTDRTGTVPFMALDLLDEDYWKGLTKRYYHHELESFIWMLPYVFLQYKEGRRHYNKLVDPWITSNIDTCREKKGHFYQRRLEAAKSMVQSGYSQCWSLARTLCQALDQQHFGIRARRMASESQTQIAGQKPDYVLDSEDLWNRVFLSLTQQLRNVESADFEALLKWFEHYKPAFILSDEDAKSLHKSYSAILNPSQPL